MKTITALIFSVCAWYSYAQTNTNLGTNAGNAGTANTSIGHFAGDKVTGYDNTFVGYYSGVNSTSGTYNAFFGSNSGQTNTTGGSNTFLGYASGYSNISGSNNTFVGRASGYATTSSDNTFVGFYAGRINSTGTANVAVGKDALFNSNSHYNNGIGYRALYNNSAAHNNALGSEALYSNTTGERNSAIGYRALHTNISGSNNVAAGYSALLSNTGSYNTGIGYESKNGAGNYNVAVGAQAGTNTTYNNTVAIGYLATATASNQVVIGNTSIASIGGYRVWTQYPSDRRFKTEIREDIPGLNFITQLRPVSYYVDYDALNDFLQIPESGKETLRGMRESPVRQIGFIAQEVEEIVIKQNFVFSGVDAPKNESSSYGIRYGEFVVPLVKAVQELSEKIDDQQKLFGELLNQKLESGQPNSLTENSAKSILHQNAPNPFTNQTVIEMEIVEEFKQVSLFIYDMEGTQIKSVPISTKGLATVTISGGEFKPGVYVYTLIADGKVVDSKRMILTK